MSHNLAIPFVGGIISRRTGDTTELLIQTRWKPETDAQYSGTWEFPAGVLDKPYESVFEALAREIKEETGLALKTVLSNSRTKTYSPQKDDASFGFRPFCCVQQLKAGKPWIGFVFLCEVESGTPTPQKEEVRDIQWMEEFEVERIFRNSPEKLFTLEIPAWEYYFSR
jgi:8-oxo-dGTP diphosphatase